MTSNSILNILLHSLAVLFIFVYVSGEDEDAIGKVRWNVGSVLFKRGISVTCFGEHEKSLLATRIQLDKLLPEFMHLPHQVNNEYEAVLKYFRKVRRNIEKMPRKINRNIVLSAYYDAIGGYLKTFLIPSAKLSFYAGNTTLVTVKHIMDLYEICRTKLDTKGLGWSNPFPELYTGNIESLPLYISNNEENCNELILLNDENGDENLIVSLPKLERDEYSNELTNIWLPFKRKHVYNLKSRQAAFIFMRYFIATKQCFELEKVSITDFYKKLERWITNNVLVHLKDETLYAGLGGVLRVLRTLKSNSSEPIFLVNKYIQHQFRREEYSHQISKYENDADYPILTSSASGNIVSNQTSSISSEDETFFTSDMMWITIFSVVGVLIVVLVLVILRQCMKKQQQSDLNKARVSAEKPSTSYWNKRNNGFLQRKSRNAFLSSGTSLNRPIDYVNPPAILSHAERDRSFIPSKPNKRKSFLNPTGAVFKKEIIQSTSSHSIFNVNSDTDSEEEIIDSKKLNAAKQEKSGLAPHAVKNGLNISVQNPENKGKLDTKDVNSNSVQTKHFTHFLIGNRKISNENVNNDKQTESEIKLDNNVFCKNCVENVITVKKSKSLEFHKPCEFQTEQQRYNIESTDWETIPDSATLIS